MAYCVLFTKFICAKNPKQGWAVCAPTAIVFLAPGELSKPELDCLLDADKILLSGTPPFFSLHRLGLGWILNHLTAFLVLILPAWAHPLPSVSLQHWRLDFLKMKTDLRMLNFRTRIPVYTCTDSQHLHRRYKFGIMCSAASFHLCGYYFCFLHGLPQ